MSDTIQDVLTTGEAATRCGISRSTLRRAVANGQLTAWHTPGRHLRFTRDSCEAFARRLGRGEVSVHDNAEGPSPEQQPAGNAR